ncbi:folate family ECF transporter S component [Melissococcus plutonius]|uniref:Substrate-specific component FolT of folate ECF transporter n=1 Tax=Melissococcus plutonius (strain ATCC 35311 / DSM 29964 / CIP 104052 / LMG 20360 / NCIMB 702443) TaxID=940190 RepID=F3Y9K9_MELPT|nr:folate family ECF transporter S component [Melissococcus plutonius]MBB5177041.1 ECF transporter S component (folate family) [Melissococcus plutonius]BAK21187.1 substrate-specific component FolT of folate ECF transporter [Melissococcus plutonius ATCC 35311]BBD15007.1 substrate-specific component FolT of folate ECF transporter [Melissococcus plutonius]BBD16445.1 substrate-specific component FolT of folate ECF transporter [Melissococcus plutonius]BBP07000.1 substrate-specific component FolT of
MLKKKSRLETRMVTLLGLLIALMVIFSRFITYETQFLKVGLTFIPETLTAMLFGPFWTGISLAVADIVGMLLFPKAAYFPGFTLNAFLTGLIYGYFYYRKKITWLRTISATLVVTILIHLFLVPLWLGLMYGVDLKNFVWWVPRIIKNLIFVPIQVIITYYLGNKISSYNFLKR